MLDALIVFAATEGGSSSALFYIVGGIAAAYAVVIGGIGITQPEFPRTQGTARGVFALSTLMVLAAMASAILSS